MLQKPHADITGPEKPHQPKKKGPPAKPSEGREDARPKTTVPRSQADEEFLKQSLKEKQLQETFRLNEIDKESQKPFEVKGPLLVHTKSGSSAPPKGSPAPTVLAEEATAGAAASHSSWGSRGASGKTRARAPAQGGPSPAQKGNLRDTGNRRTPEGWRGNCGRSDTTKQFGDSSC